MRGPRVRLGGEPLGPLPQRNYMHFRKTIAFVALAESWIVQPTMAPVYSGPVSVDVEASVT